MPQPDMPLISVLTPSYNQGRYIEQAIVSVLQQGYPSVEHIVIDGGSTDSTISILKRYPHLKWVSEPDRGQADALNKGLGMATGEVVGWINSDDFYALGAFAHVREVFRDESVEWAIGDVANFYNGSGIEFYSRSATVTYHSLLQNPDILRQQAAFFRARLLRTAGAWDASLHMAMDLDLWLRLARTTAPRMMHEKMAYWRIHPEQKSGSKMSKLQSGEIDRILRQHRVSTAHRLRQLGKKRCWRLKSTVKQCLTKTGILDVDFEKGEGSP
jgi:glycosyltransferase involved in cell wall biosynthesis